MVQMTRILRNLFRRRPRAPRPRTLEIVCECGVRYDFHVGEFSTLTYYQCLRCGKNVLA